MEVEITKIRQRPRLSAAGELIEYMEADYMVGEHGPFTYSVRKDQFSKEKMKEAIRAEAEKIKDLVEKFEV